MGFFALRKEQRPYWRRQPLLTQPTVSIDLDLEGAATSSGDLIFVAATPGFFDARMPPHVYEKPHIWRHFPRTMGQPQQIYSFVLTGAATSAGTLDVATGGSAAGFFSSKGRPGPAYYRLPYWRRQVGAPSAPIVYDLLFTGAATSTGTLQLDVQVDLQFSGSATSGGTLGLSVQVDLQFTGSQTSSGSLDVAIGGSAAGFFASQARPGSRLYQRPIWRRQAPLEAGIPPEWLLRGVFSTAGTLQLDVQVDLRLLGAGTSTGTLAVVVVAALQFTGSASSAGTLAVAVASDLQFSGSYTSVGALDVAVGGSAAGFFASQGKPGPRYLARPLWRRQDALPSVPGPYLLVGAASSAGTLDLWVQVDLRATGVATSAGALALAGIADLRFTGASTSAGTLGVAVTVDLSFSGATTSAGALDVGVSGSAAGFFASQGRPGPQFIVRPYWRRQDALPSVPGGYALLGAASSAGTLDFRVTIDLAAIGAATSAGTLGLAVLVDLRTVGTATSSGVLALSSLVDLAFQGASSSLGSIAIDWNTPAPGYFGNRPVPQRDYRAFWRRAATIAQASFGYELLGAASTAGTLDLRQTIDLRAAGTSTSAGSLALSVVVDLRFLGAATTAGTLALSVIVDLRTIGAATSAGTLTVGIPAMMVATGAATSAGSLALSVLLDLRASGTAISLGGLLLDLFTPTPGIFTNRPGPRYFARPYWRRQALLDVGGDTHPWQGAGGGTSSGSLDLTIILSPAGIGNPAAEPVFTWDPVLRGYHIGRRTRGNEPSGRAGRSPQGRR